MLLLGLFSSEYLATATFVEEVDKLLDSFNSVSFAVRGKELHCPRDKFSYRLLDQSKYKNKELELFQGW
jgi:hypothetical protein